MTGMKFREISRLPEFERDLRHLRKRYPTLEEDLATFVTTALVAFHRFNLDVGIVAISGLGRTTTLICKARKFACRSLKGKGARSGIRIIYAFNETADTIELIEIYCKSDQKNEDRARIRRHYPSK